MRKLWRKGVVRGLCTLLLLLVGLPGYFDDAMAWFGWFNAVSIEAAAIYQPIALAGAGAMFLWATSEWWWQRLPMRIRSFREQQNASTALDSDQATFKEMYQLLEQAANARYPFWGIASRLFIPSAKPAIDGVDLMTRLRHLSIPFPATNADEGIWYWYLVNLAALSRVGNLDGARKLLTGNEREIASSSKPQATNGNT